MGNVNPSSRRRVCVGIRTHRFGEPERTLHRVLAQYFDPADIFIVVDETRQTVSVPDEYHKVGFDRRALAELALFSDFDRIGWLCGDYFYYFLHREARADAYWLIEPDVRFTHADVGTFFRPYESLEFDFMAPRFGKMDATWGWHQRALQISHELYGCVYPITRITARAIECLLPARQDLTRQLAERGATWKDYPNDESFTATTAMQLGLDCADMVATDRDAFTHFSVHSPYLWDIAQTGIRPGKVVHPALTGEDFWLGLDKKLGALFNRSELRPLMEAATAGGSAEHSTRVREAVLQAAMRWLDRFDRSPAAAGRQQAGGRQAATPETQPPPAGIHAYAIVARDKARLAVASPADFRLGERTAAGLDETDLRTFTPYCFDYAADVFLLVDTPRQALDEAFLYQGQFKHASAVLRIDRASMKERCQAIAGGAPLRPVLVFSIGRCGSTLFSKLSGAAGLSSFSEPDIYTGINPHKTDPRTGDVLTCSTVQLAAYAGVPDSRLCLKFRSASSGAMAQFMAALPEARYIFLLRNLRDWSASFIDKFDWGHDQLYRTLAAADRGLGALERAGIPHIVLNYEDFSAHPEIVYRALTGAEAIPKAVQARLQAMSATDSQAGAGIASRHGRLETRARVESFLKHWQETAPPALQNRFHIDSSELASCP